MLKSHAKPMALALAAVAWQVARHILTVKNASPVGYRAAYVDPGTGLLALQILGSSVVGVFYLLRSKMSSLFQRSKKVPSESRSSNQ